MSLSNEFGKITCDCYCIGCVWFFYMRIPLYLLVTCDLFKAPTTEFDGKVTEVPFSVPGTKISESDISDLVQLVNHEGGLIHNLFKLLRLEVAVFNSVEKRLHLRSKRIKRNANSQRLNQCQSILDSAKSDISSQVKSIKAARKIWSATKASTEKCDLFSNVLKLRAFHPTISAEIELNGGIVRSAISQLEQEKNSLFSRKLKLVEIVDDSPERLAELNRAREGLYRTANELTLSFDSANEYIKYFGSDCSSKDRGDSETDV
jgi:hypothetical protein